MRKIKQKIKIILNIIIILALFMLNVPVVSADNNIVTDEAFIGSLINASQGGQSRGNNENVERLGSQVIGGQRGSGNRLGTTPKRGGNNISWNPSLVDIDILYNDYTNYVNTINTDAFIIPIHKTFTTHANTRVNIDENLIRGFIVETPLSDGLDVPTRFHHIRAPKTYKDMYVRVENKTDGDIIQRWINNSSGGAYNNNNAMTSVTSFPYNYNVNISSRKAEGLAIHSTKLSGYSSFHVSYIVLSNDSFNLNNIDILHNNTNVPTKEEFINNYTNTFNLEYDNSTNQLVQNNNYYNYNLNDFSDNSVTINNNYVINNYIEITNPEIPDEPDEPDDIGEQENYTSLLERVISAIKDLPQQIRDKFDDFSGGGNTQPEPVEEGKGFWASLFDAISSIVSAFSDFITSIPGLITDLLNGLLGLVEKIVELFIPTTEQMDQLKQSFSGLTDDLSFKFSPITESVESIKTVFSNPKSIYSLTYDFNGQTINVIPIQLQSHINNFRGVLNGVVVLSTFISIYKRFVGREDVIK